MPTLTTGSHGGRLVKPGLQSVMLEEHRRFPQIRETLFNTPPFDGRQNYESQGYTGFGTVPEKAEAARITVGQNSPGYHKSVTQTTYALELVFSMELLMFDLYGVYTGGRSAKVARAFSYAFDYTRDLLCAQVFNTGFGTTVFTVGDGLALFSASHTSPADGETRSNLPTAADLDETSLEAALTLVRSTTDEEGKPIHLIPRYLVVAPAGEWDALKLIESAYEPETGNNAINPIRTRRLQVIVWELMEDSDAWFIVCEKQDHDLKFIEAITPRFTMDGDFHTEDSLMKGVMMNLIHINAWEGVVGNTGAA